MSCTHPLKGFKIGINEETGKNRFKVTSYNIQYIIKKMINGKMEYICCDTPFVQYAPGQYDVGVITDFVEIPCGKCVSCRRLNAARWSDRLMLELQDHQESCFLTLTYDDEHITWVNDASGDSDDIIYTLNKRDFQLFMKRLRKRIEPKKVRFFACGEYGETTFRPHFHVILFGWCPSDLIQFKKNFQNDILYISEELSSIWQNGNVLVGKVTQNSCRYVARYCMKKAFGVDALFYEKMGVLPEFIEMSRKPGIGRKYFELHYDEIAKYKTINVSTDTGGISMSIPPYYVNLIESVDPDLYREIKLSNKRAALLRKEVMLSRTDLDYSTYLSILEDKFIRKEKLYRRDAIL